ncbi:hypothetical protein [Desulfotruncus alcoholivorax]|uniref:hypothetical protein n=1 Tax=Desulfotruncus alcoholivorax TaxID=265477 RepID=UPI0003FE6518|nr:hypothetical protein [Desulfotruncus alcoholivorax]
MRKIFPNLLPKLFPLLIILLWLAVFGCSAQKKPAPPAQPAKLIPSESNIGFTEVDQNQIPSSVKKIISAMSGMQEAAWAAVGNNNYIILNPEDKNETVKISEVIQRVPSQNFVWLDVKLVEDDLKENQKSDQPSRMKIYRLAKTDKAVNGVSFEYKETEEEEKPEAAAPKQPAPTPAPAPAPAPSVTPTPSQGPVQQVKPAPEKKQPATPEQTAPGRQQTEKQAPGETGNQGASQ